LPAPAVKVFLVGHDWGAIVSWNLCLLRPDRVRALVNLSVAFMPRNPSIKPVDYFRRAYGDDYYVCRFQVRNSVRSLAPCRLTIRVCIYRTNLFKLKRNYEND
jgi:pimeloyl-ACP methyl ester carboxylesterase